MISRIYIEMVDEMLRKSDAEIRNQFNINYSETAEKQGKNLIAYEVAKRNVYHFLSLEKEQLKQGDDVTVIALEQQLNTVIEDPRLPYPIKLAGIADRVEIRNGILRIIDYKTGKVELNQVQINAIEGITTDLKYEKAIQLLIYGLMYKSETELPIQAGIYSFKNRKSGYLMFGLKVDKQTNSDFSDEILHAFKTELVTLLLEILNPELLFEEKVI